MKKITDRIGITKGPEPFENFGCTKSGKNLVFDYVGARLEPDNIDALSTMPSLQILREFARFHKPEGENGYSMLTCFRGPYAAEYMARKKPSAARMNADNYAYFALANYVHTLCRPVATRPPRSSLDGKGRYMFEKEWNEFSKRSPTLSPEDLIFGLDTSLPEESQLTDEKIEEEVSKSEPNTRAAVISFMKFQREKAAKVGEKLAGIQAEQYWLQTCNLGSFANADGKQPLVPDSKRTLTWKEIEEQMLQRDLKLKL